MDQQATDAPASESTHITKIVFSDDTAISLSPNSLVVFCGPNNAGKSASLREIRTYLNNSQPGVVVRKVEFVFPYDKEQAFSLLKQSAHIVSTDSVGSPEYQGLGFRISETNMGYYFTTSQNRTRLGSFVDFFTAYSSTITRISDSDPPRSVALLRNPPQHAIHNLQYDDDLLKQMSGYFFRAFGQALIVHHGGGGEVPLYVGPPVDLETGEHLLSFSYLRRLEDAARPLHQQGDGMRSFVSVMLKAVTPSHATILFIDEPEAFLHPPQAKLIGEFLAAERREGVQMFIATHSAEVIEGILKAASEDTHLIRITRTENQNAVRVLDNQAVREIANEPLLRYSNLLDGLFHKHVVICEAETDSAFYNALMDSVSDNQSSDILFSHGNGKASLAKIVKSLSSLHVPVSCITDIDVLNDENVFRILFESLGGKWDEVQAPFRRFQKSVEGWSNFLKVGDVRKEVTSALSELKENDPLTTGARKKIADAIKRSSPWEALKTAGRHGVPAGQMIADFDGLVSAAASKRLWIVPVGEVESFCKTASAGHGPAWLRNVLTTYNVGTAPELTEARQFIERVYGGIRSLD